MYFLSSGIPEVVVGRRDDLVEGCRALAIAVPTSAWTQVVRRHRPVQASLVMLPGGHGLVPDGSVYRDLNQRSLGSPRGARASNCSPTLFPDPGVLGLRLAGFGHHRHSGGGHSWFKLRYFPGSSAFLASAWLGPQGLPCLFSREPGARPSLRFDSFPEAVAAPRRRAAPRRAWIARPARRRLLPLRHGPWLRTTTSPPANRASERGTS